MELQERLEPVEPLKAVEPPFLLSTAAFSPAPSSSSLVWPIGVACLVGLAIGFGAGYTVALRDRASVAAPVNDAKAGDDVQLPAEPIAPAVAAAVKPAAPEAPKPAPFDGRLVVRSTPSGARVVVDGRDRGATPATVGDLSRGEHRVRVVRDGYTAAERRIVLSPSRPSQLLSVPLAKAPLSTKLAVVQQPKADASPGTLVVESRPEGATVFVDAKAVGRTPLTLPNVKAGDHALRLELDGFRQWTAPFKIVGGAPNRVGASLEK